MAKSVARKLFEASQPKPKITRERKKKEETIEKIRKRVEKKCRKEEKRSIRSFNKERGKLIARMIRERWAEEEEAAKTAVNAAQTNASATSQSAVDNNHTPVQQAVDNTVPPTASTLPPMASMEQEYQPSYDDDIFENEPEPVAELSHLISYEHDQQQKEWQEEETQRIEKSKNRKEESLKARKQIAQDHLDWWKNIEPAVSQSYQKLISGTGKPPPGSFSDNFKQYDCNGCYPRCEVHLICLSGR